MKRQLSIFLCIGLMVSTVFAGKPTRPGPLHVIDRLITQDLLEQCGFESAPKGTNTHIVKEVRLGDMLRRLEINTTDLQRVACLAEGEDVRYVAFRNGHFVFEAKHSVVNGQPIAESLDMPESKCTVTVVFPKPDQGTGKGQK